ncbi:MAG: hypothetical protein WDN06_02695 [Asticcacaulis sp.]
MSGAITMMSRLSGLAAVLCASAALWQAAPARADTVVRVTETHYDAMNRPDCVAVRMNPATFADAPSSACVAKTAGTFGGDRITKTTYDFVGHVSEIDQAYGTADQRAYARYTYTNNGLKTTEEDANSNKTGYYYDGLDRLVQITYSVATPGMNTGNSSDYHYYTYDANGNMTGDHKRDGRWDYYFYDFLNRQTANRPPTRPFPPSIPITTCSAIRA